MNKELFILAVFIIVFVLMIPKAYAIPERNTEYIPGSIGVSDLSTFVKSLEQLKNLNDPVVNMYIQEIETSINNRDYANADKLLAELQSYLKDKYGNLSGLDPELAKDIAYIESIKELNERGAVVDVTQYLNNLASIIKDPNELKQLLDIAKKLQSGLPLSESEKALLGKMLESFNIKEAEPGNIPLNELSNLLNTTNPENIAIPKISVPSAMNISLPSSNPSMPGLVSLGSPGPILLPAIPAEYLALILIPLVLLSIIYLTKKHYPSLYLSIKKKLARTIATTISRIKHVDDPVARLYRLWLSLSHALGYPRYSWETPREHLWKIKDDILRKRGAMVVRLYEMKFYGFKEPRKEEIEKAMKELEAE